MPPIDQDPAEVVKAAEQEHAEIVVARPTAVAQMEKIQVDTQIATAKQYPMHSTGEQITQFKNKAIALATTDEEVAAACHYRRPVGKKDGKVEYAEGESVRLAEIVYGAYGNIKVQCFVTEMEPKHVKAVARCHDMENNIAIETEAVESTVTKSGRPFSPRMRIVVAKAAMSKAFRDAVFRVVPKALIRPVAKAAEEIASGAKLDLNQRRQRVGSWLVTLGVDPNRIWAALGVSCLEDLQDEHFVTLSGIRTAIKDGDCTVDECFPPLQITDEKAGVAGVTEAMKKTTGQDPPPANQQKRTTKKKTAKKTTKKKSQKKAAPKPAMLECICPACETKWECTEAEIAAGEPCECGKANIVPLEDYKKQQAEEGPIDCICPACERTYKYSMAAVMEGVQCECQQANIMPLPEYQAMQQEAEPEADPSDAQTAEDETTDQTESGPNAEPVDSESSSAAGEPEPSGDPFLCTRCKKSYETPDAEMGDGLHKCPKCYGIMVPKQTK